MYLKRIIVVRKGIRNNWQIRMKFKNELKEILQIRKKNCFSNKNHKVTSRSVAAFSDLNLSLELKCILCKVSKLIF